MYPQANVSLPISPRFQPLVLYSGKLEYLWTEFQKFPQAFDDIVPRTFEAFRDTMMSPTNQFYEFVQDEQIVGLAAATNVRPRLDAVMHLLMFDRRLRGRESSIKGALRDFARRGQLRRLTVFLPDNNQTARKLVERLGFQLEGTMRKAYLRDGVYSNYLIYGILAEELYSDDATSQRLREAGGDGNGVRGSIRGERDVLPAESFHGEDEADHVQRDGNSAGSP